MRSPICRAKSSTKCCSCWHRNRATASTATDCTATCSKRACRERDSDFGFATYHELSEGFSPAARLARWAAAGPYPTYDPEVIELACIPLCWLLSSPNRFMRDWVTKALVQLLRGHLDVMRALFERFWTVDDPYVVQRVAADCVRRRCCAARPPRRIRRRRSLNSCTTRVFTRPVRPDELLLDAARGIEPVGGGPSSCCRTQPWTRLDVPYGLKPPGPPPTEATLDAKYGWREGQPDDESYSSIHSSVLSMGDFGRYVVESGVHYVFALPHRAGVPRAPATRAAGSSSPSGPSSSRR